MEVPVRGTEYPLHLGASLLGKRSAQEAGPAEYCTLRYDFKPASAGRAAQGQMEVQPSNQKVSLHMGEASFAGRYEPSRDGLDCVAIFDGSSFRLELLGAAVKNLRHISGAGRADAVGRGTTPQHAAAQQAAAQPAGTVAEDSPPPAASARADPALEDAVAELGLAKALETGEAHGGGAAGQHIEGDMSIMLEDELLAALNEDGGWEEEEEAETEGGEQEEEENAEREVEEEAAQQGTVNAAAAKQQPAAPPQPLLEAPTMHHTEMTEDERLFFGYDGSPEPPVQQGDSSSGGGGNSSSEEGGCGGSDLEHEEI